MRKNGALRTAEDRDEIARQIRDYSSSGARRPTCRAQGEALWKRFKTAHDEVWGRCEAHFAAQAQVRAENLAKKLAFVERAEALAESTNWISTAEEIKRLQAEWKTVGPVTRGQEKTAWERFRAACDRFFTRRQEDLAKRKVVWAENLAKKEALCARAEALGESTEWEAAAADIKRLQSEWRAIGPVKKSRSEALWRGSAAPSDRFFARYAQRHDIARAERVAAREAVRRARALAPWAGSVEPSPDDQVGRSRESAVEPTRRAPSSRPPIYSRACVPFVCDGSKSSPRRRSRTGGRARRALLRRFQSRCHRLADGLRRTDFDPDANSKRMEALARRMEDLAASLLGAMPAEAALSPTTRLAAMLKGARDEHDRRESRWREPLARRAGRRAAGARGTGRVSVRLRQSENGSAHWPIAFRARAGAITRGRHKGRRRQEGGGRAGGSGGPGGPGRAGAAMGSEKTGPGGWERR